MTTPTPADFERARRRPCDVTTEEIAELMRESEAAMDAAVPGSEWYSADQIEKALPLADREAAAFIASANPEVVRAIALEVRRARADESLIAMAHGRLKEEHAAVLSRMQAAERKVAELAGAIEQIRAEAILARDRLKP